MPNFYILVMRPDWVVTNVISAHQRLDEARAARKRLPNSRMARIVEMKSDTEDVKAALIRARDTFTECNPIQLKFVD